MVRILGLQGEWAVLPVVDAASGERELIMQEGLEMAASQKLLTAARAGRRGGCAISLSCVVHPRERERENIVCRKN